MKKVIIAFAAMAMMFSVTSCSDDSAATDTTDLESLVSGLEDLASTIKETPTTPEAPTMVVTDEMKAFTAMLDGTSDGATAALEMYGANETVVDHDMGMYNLKSPKVISQTDNCYRMDCISGAVTNTYILCWVDGKIVSVEEIL